MFKAPDRNFDRAPIEADHSIARADGGTLADRLLHHRCNRQRGRGNRDHLRPALTGRPFPERAAIDDRAQWCLLPW